MVKTTGFQLANEIAEVLGLKIDVTCQLHLICELGADPKLVIVKPIKGLEMEAVFGTVAKYIVTETKLVLSGDRVKVESAAKPVLP